MLDQTLAPSEPFYSGLSLSFLLLLPILGSLILLAIPDSKIRTIRTLGFCISLFAFLYSLFFWLYFDNSTSKFQFVEERSWIPSSNINFVLGLDGISLFFVM